MKKLLITLLVISVMIPGMSFAHEPRIPEGNSTIVSAPEISKAYYSQLSGVSQTYTISSGIPFALYVNILVPDIAGQKKDISAKIIQDGNIEKPFAILDGSSFEWTKLFEPFGHDHYWTGPEYRVQAAPGKYDIVVSSPNIDSKYALAIGETELFDLPEIINALDLVPRIKRDFFDESPITFILSPFGWGLILIMFVFAFIVGFVYRFVLRKFAHTSIRKIQKNIDLQDRLIRAGIGCFLLIWAITTSWSPILLFFSGFAFFEAIFSWCALYAALGKDSCPRDTGDHS